MHAFARAVQEKRIPVDKVSEGLWKKLLEEGVLQVVANEPAEPRLGGSTDQTRARARSAASD
jgi:hypothetical protein